MKRKILLLLCVSLLLTGCSLPGKRYVSVKPHQESRKNVRSEAAVAINYWDLTVVLKELISEGAETGVINIAQYPSERVEDGMDRAIRYVLEEYPLGAYAVEEISYEVGTTGGIPAMAVNISYRHSSVLLRQIRHLTDMGEVDALVAEALDHYEPMLVMEVEKYEDRDFQQMVRDYAENYPETVVEIPQLTVGIYGNGGNRVVELSFGYQNGRDALRHMHKQISPVFEAARLYVGGEGADRQKFSQLYSFLMERFDYKVETSITPAYSLLYHGVGDSRAFATVYAAMCSKAGLECRTVTGTHSGEPWTWNLIYVDGVYRHLDLLQCSRMGQFKLCTDRDMEGYVWDYSAYPACPVVKSAAQEDAIPEKTGQTDGQPDATEEATAPAPEDPESPVNTHPQETVPEFAE